MAVAPAKPIFHYDRAYREQCLRRRLMDYPADEPFLTLIRHHDFTAAAKLMTTISTAFLHEHYIGNERHYTEYEEGDFTRDLLYFKKLRERHSRRYREPDMLD